MSCTALAGACDSITEISVELEALEELTGQFWQTSRGAAGRQSPWLAREDPVRNLMGAAPLLAAGSRLYSGVRKLGRGTKQKNSEPSSPDGTYGLGDSGSIFSQPVPKFAHW